MDELEKAHEDYEERKARLIDNLEIMKANLSGGYVPVTYLHWLNEAINFINEREV